MARSTSHGRRVLILSLTVLRCHYSHCHWLSLTVLAGTVLLQSLLSFSAKMTVSPMAKVDGEDDLATICGSGCVDEMVDCSTELVGTGAPRLKASPTFVKNKKKKFSP